MGDGGVAGVGRVVGVPKFYSHGSFLSHLVNGLHMSIKCPSSEQQTCEQEVAVHFDRSSFFIFQH